MKKAMKAAGIGILKILSLTACGLGLAVLIAFDVPVRGAEATPALSSAEIAEANAAKAIAKGDLAAAKGWSEVAFNTRAGQYLKPFSELTQQFAGQLGNLKSFVGGAAEVEAVKPVTDWYRASSKYSMTALRAVMVDNDPAAFKLACARQAVWDVLRDVHYKTTEALPYEQRKTMEPAQGDFVALMSWLEAGASGASVPGSELMTKVVSSQETQAGLEPFRKLLTPAKEVAGK